MIVQPVVEPMDRFAALIQILSGGGQACTELSECDLLLAQAVSENSFMKNSMSMNHIIVGLEGVFSTHNEEERNTITQKACLIHH